MFWECYFMVEKIKPNRNFNLAKKTTKWQSKTNFTSSFCLLGIYVYTARIQRLEEKKCC